MIIVFNINYQLQYSPEAILVLYMVLVKYKILIIVSHLLMLCRLCWDKIIIPFF